MPRNSVSSSNTGSPQRDFVAAVCVDYLASLLENPKKAKASRYAAFADEGSTLQLAGDFLRDFRLQGQPHRLACVSTSENVELSGSAKPQLASVFDEVEPCCEVTVDEPAARDSIATCAVGAAVTILFGVGTSTTIVDAAKSLDQRSKVIVVTDLCVDEDEYRHFAGLDELATFCWLTSKASALQLANQLVAESASAAA